jgi:homoserine O-acetyltransferase
MIPKKMGVLSKFTAVCMNKSVTIILIVSIFLLGILEVAAQPTGKEGSYVIKNFKFKSGETLDELRINYATWGEPKRDNTGKVTNAVLLCHGTSGRWQIFGAPFWASTMYGPGQPLDITKYYVIASDTIGAGKSSKPSDGLRIKFPKYITEDVVKAQHALLTEGLNINYLVAVAGYSFGGRQAWQWGIQYPDFMAGIIPMASSPFPNAGRRGMQDFLPIELIIKDPTWENGEYSEQPNNLAISWMYGVLFGFGTVHLWEVAPTREQSFQYLPELFKKMGRDADANDSIYQYRVNDGFDAYNQLDKIKSQVLVVNFVGDPMVPIELNHIEKAKEKLGEKCEYLLVKESSKLGHLALMATMNISGAKIGEFLKKIEPISGK